MKPAPEDFADINEDLAHVRQAAPSNLRTAQAQIDCLITMLGQYQLPSGEYRRALNAAREARKALLIAIEAAQKI